MSQPLMDPLSLLRKIQQETQQHTGLPQEVEAAVLWSGVGFRLGDMTLVCPLNQVLEVMPAPSMTPVPGVRSWVKGVSNIRGNLYTVVDLPEYFGKPSVFHDDKARAMILNIPGLNTAVVVNEVLGLRHFDEELERQDLTGIDDPVLVHLTGAFLHNDKLWGVFDMKSLAESMTFRHVAA